MLSNAYSLAKFRFDTAENEPAKNFVNFNLELADLRMDEVTCGTDCFTDDAALCDSADCADVALAAACPEKCGRAALSSASSGISLQFSGKRCGNVRQHFTIIFPHPR